MKRFLNENSSSSCFAFLQGVHKDGNIVSLPDCLLLYLMNLHSLGEEPVFNDDKRVTSVATIVQGQNGIQIKTPLYLYSAKKSFQSSTSAASFFRDEPVHDHEAAGGWHLWECADGQE